MADKTKYIYGNQFAQKLPGSNQNFYFRTITGYKVDNNGKPIEGTARTDLYYAPKPAARTSDGKTWTPGTADSIDNFNPGGWVRAGSTTDNGKTYNFRNYSQEDADLGKIPPGKNVGDEVLGTTAQQSLTTSGGRFYEAVQNSLINTAGNPGLAKVVSAKQANAAQVNPDGGVPPAGGSNPQPDSGTESDPFNGGPITFEDAPTPESAYTAKEKTDKIVSSFGSARLQYPLDMKDDQDRIVFSRHEYAPKSLNDTTLGTENSYLGAPISTIILPIQSGISDNNSVEWGGSSMNEIERFMSATAMKAMNPDKKLSETATEAGETAYTRFIKENPGMYKYYFAQEAVGVQGLLSRASGSILNPNLSLLFNGPALRPFSFTFRLTPRSAKESKNVKGIIREFKEGSAVNASTNNVFLKAPDVFKIEYNGKAKDSLNRFKTCALTSVSVNYTPDGTYMTYQDGTMTSYEITLTFNELDPIYQTDYKNLSADAIGF